MATGLGKTRADHVAHGQDRDVKPRPLGTEAGILVHGNAVMATPTTAATKAINSVVFVASFVSVVNRLARDDLSGARPDLLRLVLLLGRGRTRCCRDKRAVAVMFDRPLQTARVHRG